ncbi:MAG TPA: acetyl-CoA carboxylase biotin carboxyl carrier protein subunit [Anaerolineales bacterium]|nr:acetyl-CoA carboxylase biotin carboxyl carrier protein subunit [Anaerolineales bacterium]
MKYIVKVADKSYEVEIEDIHARPVIARLDGQVFEVNPEDRIQSASQKEPTLLKPVEMSKPPSGSSAGANEMTAPLPGTVIEIFIKAGDQIEAGQVILVIEAMKMKNSIRSRRAGKIAEVLVNAGQTVAHKQVLVRFG